MKNELLSIKEVTEAFNISRATLYRMIDSGLPFHTVGTRKKFEKETVKEYLEQRKNETLDDLEVGKEYTNYDIVEIFKVGNMGGMRRSHTKNALVLISFQDGSSHLYQDRWDGDILYYTGQGTEGDQDFMAYQNKTLFNSRTNGITVYLFEMFTSQLYQYRGIVELAGEPYMEEENDINGNVRKVCKFPLKLINNKNYLSEEFIRNEFAHQVDKTKMIPTSELALTATHIKAQPSERTVVTKSYTSNPVLFAYAKLRADGKCECCGAPAPFKVNGEPYLQITHIIPISQGGLDSADNIAAVCPNCNCKFSMIGTEKDRKMIRKNVEQDENKLQKKLRP